MKEKYVKMKHSEVVRVLGLLRRLERDFLDKSINPVNKDEAERDERTHKRIRRFIKKFKDAA